jgi:hypothetical protein
MERGREERERVMNEDGGKRKTSGVKCLVPVLESPGPRL